jgi:crotonobetainyl-CoA:carnitine CoA-transferase CaiB-like acyl-CoA transferase
MRRPYRNQSKTWTSAAMTTGTDQGNRDLPLSGVVIIELGHSVAAPYACEILGDLGADVIKIEKADGDDARNWAPPYWGAMSATFQSLNRNKRSVVVNLKNPAERERLRKLIVERADVVVQNLRPGSAAEFGLDADTLRAVKPALIYCTIGAFGGTGPLKDRPGYDPLMQAFGGLMSVTGEPQQRPVRVGTSIIDMAAGMWSVIGVVIALLQRRDHGKGSSIDTSLFETALGWMCYHAANFQASGELPKRQGSGAAMIVPYRGYASKDGFIVIAAGNDKLFASLARVLGHPEWIDDPRFRANPDRVRNQDVLYRWIEDLIPTRSNKEWATILDEAGVPNAPMQTIAEVLDHPQTKALGMLQQSPQGDITLLGLPISFDGARPAFRRSPPALGAHTKEILGDHAASAVAVKP